MFHPLCWSEDAYSDQILKQNTNTVVTIKFILFAVIKQK